VRRAVATVATSALVAGAVAFTPLAASAAVTEGTITDAVFEWGLSNEAGGGSFFGGCNFLSAGTAGNTGSSRLWTEADGFYQASEGNVSILKDGPDGTRIEPTWSTKCQTAAGTPVSAGSTASKSGNVVRIVDGTGSVAGDGSFEIEWDGDFSVVFYGGLTYWTASDPVLTVDAAGTGQITATASGYGTSMEDMDSWEAIAPREIVLADLTDVEATDTGFTATPAYLGVETASAVGTPQVRTGATWGSFPQSYVAFQDLTGQHSYWYSSGGSRDAAKPAVPVTVSYDVVAPAATATSLAVSPATRVVAGADVTLTATVANTDDASAVPAGTVQFFSKATGASAATPVGSPVELASGTATLTTAALAAGGHVFTATYSPRGAFASSASAASANLGVVDTTAPAAYEPGEDAVVGAETATARWNWSVYGDNAQPAAWAKIASGDVSLDGRTFVFADGVVTSDAGGAKIQFEGTARVSAYAGISGHGPDGAWIELVDPALHVKADGTGVWVAGVHAAQNIGGAGAYAPNPTAPRKVVAAFTGLDAAPGTAVDTTVAFDFLDVAAKGTWNANFNGSWQNAFILTAPTAIQPFYFLTGDSASQLSKAPAPLAVDFTWPALTLDTATPTVSGTAKVGSTLTAKAGVWTAGTSLSYQWLRSGSAIPGASGPTYTAVAGDMGKNVSVRVTGAKTGYATASVTSAAVTVAAGTLTAKTPTISGTAKVGAKLTAKPGTWTAGTTLKYQWSVGGKTVAGATKSTYTPAAADRGKTVKVTVTGSKSGYTSVSKTSAVEKVAYGTLTAATPRISGTAKAGKKLTAVTGTWTSGTKLTYQWYVTGKAVRGATKSTYTVRSADRGKNIVVKVKGSKPGYTSVTKKSAAKKVAR
jgi:hypothetical protein